MATTNPFSSLFGKSPFKPMQEHMRVVGKCARTVSDLIDAACANDKDKAEAQCVSIFDLEHEADRIKNDIRAHLPKSLLMPVDRRDLLEVLDVQDNIADTAQDIAGLIRLREMDVPESMNAGLIALTARCVDACKQAERVIESLDELVETGFRGRESDNVSEMVDELNKIESDTDQMAADLTRELFALEDEMKAVAVFFWYEMIQKISNLADDAEKVGNLLRLLLAR